VITLSNIDANYEIRMPHAKRIPYLLSYWIFGRLKLWYDVNHQIKYPRYSNPTKSPEENM